MCEVIRNTIFLGTLQLGFDSCHEKGFFSLRHRVKTGSVSYTASYPIGIGGSFLEGKVAGA
jgi:hypothetical protein